MHSSQVGNAGAAIFIAVWNLISVVVEYFLLVTIYEKFPDLSRKTQRNDEIIKNPEETAVNDSKSCNNVKQFKMFKSIWSAMINTFKSWKSYMSHPLRNAGIGLAFLYMTVLGFDNITYGFCMRQCVTESVIGALVGVSAIFGVLGSVTFPLLRKKVGLTKTGLVGFGSLVATLVLSLASIWLQGSPFHAKFYFGLNDNDNGNEDAKTVNLGNETISRSETGQQVVQGCHVSSFISVGFFLSGVICARFGLWISDLTVNQVLQEEVANEERGSINGVQVTDQ